MFWVVQHRCIAELAGHSTCMLLFRSKFLKPSLNRSHSPVHCPPICPPSMQVLCVLTPCVAVARC